MQLHPNVTWLLLLRDNTRLDWNKLTALTKSLDQSKQRVEKTKNISTWYKLLLFWLTQHLINFVLSMQIFAKKVKKKMVDKNDKISQNWTIIEHKLEIS